MSPESSPAAPLPPGQSSPLLAGLTPGTRVRVTQQITARHYAFVVPVEGTIVSVGERPTGSWYAHGKGDRLWLERIVLRKPDGEVTTLNLDESSQIELLD